MAEHCGRFWTESLKEFVRQNSDKVTDQHIAASISRLTGHYVSAQAVRLARKYFNLGPDKNKDED